MEALLIEFWADLPVYLKVILGVTLFFSKEIIGIFKRKPSKRYIEIIIQATEEHIYRRIELKREC